MNIRFLHGTALIAGLGVALAVAGCGPANNTTSTTGGNTASSGDAIAQVGGTAITHADLGALLETQYGAQTLPYLIDTQLVLEEGKAKNITVSDEDVEADLKRRSIGNAQLEEAIKKGGQQVEFMKGQIKRELTVQRLLTADVKSDDAKVKAFFTKYQNYYNEPAKYKVGLLASSTKARAEAMSRALKAKSKTFEQLVAEQKANANDAAGQALSSADRPQFELVENFPPAIGAQLAKLPKGGVTPITEQQVGLPTPVYIIFRVVDIQPAKKADFTALKSQAETDYKLAQLAQEEVKKNPSNPAFDITLTRTKASLAQQSPGSTPTLRDVLNFILQYPLQSYIQSLRTKGTVQISDPNYTAIAEQYQPPVTPAASGTPAAGGAPAAGTPAAGAAPEAGSTPAATKAAG